MRQTLKTRTQQRKKAHNSKQPQPAGYRGFESKDNGFLGNKPHTADFLGDLGRGK
jgi:hypothetical protein